MPKHIIRTFVPCILMVSTFGFAEGPDDASDEFSAHGFNVLRVENEDKITVPREQATAVWDYLVRRLVEDKEFLTGLDPAFTSSFSIEDFTDTYFDTPNLDLLTRRSGVRHRGRVNLTNPEDRKHGRELMQIKLNDIFDEQLERAELKFEVKYPTDFETPEDRHPVLGIVKRGHRQPFKDRLTEIGIDPFSLRNILTIRDLRRRIYILRNGRPFMSISHDSVKSELLWATFEFVEIEPELNEIAYTEADPATRASMVGIGTQITSDLVAAFPALRRDLTPKYNKAFASFEAQIPMLRTLIRTNLTRVGDLLGLAIVVSLALFMGGILCKRFIDGRLRRRFASTAQAVGV